MSALDMPPQEDSSDSALSALSVNPAVDLNDVQSRKDVFNRAVQRILDARNSMQAPYAGNDLGLLSFGAEMSKGGPIAANFSNAMLQRALAQQKQQEAQQQFGQQKQGMDVQADMARILGSGMTPDNLSAAAGLGAISGMDKPAEALTDMNYKQQLLEQGKYLPIKDAFGNVTSVLNAKTGHLVNPSGISGGNSHSPPISDENPSDDPQAAAQQILDEQGTPFTPVATRQDITGRNAQAKAYRDSANGAKAAIQHLDALDAQTGKYTPGRGMNLLYGGLAVAGEGGKETSARAEADKESKNLANSFMQQNVGAKGSGIRMVEFDAGAVPNADMPDEARTELIKKNKAIANSQIQRAAISDLYPRMHISNVNAIMDNYEAKNPPMLPDGSVNPRWMTYQDWLKAGRPNTAAKALGGEVQGAPKGSTAAPDYSHLWGK